MKKKALIVILAAILVVGIGAAGTLAWLTSTSGPITNTFTIGKVDITLTETGTTDGTKAYKLIPGQDFTKDPKVTVLAGSEECYVFVKLEKSSAMGDGTGALQYSIADGWDDLTGVSGVYYRTVNASDSTADLSFDILTGNKVTVANTVTGGQLAALVASGESNAWLKFTAYAIQKANLNPGTEGEVAYAWAQLNS